MPNQENEPAGSSEQSIKMFEGVLRAESAAIDAAAERLGSEVEAAIKLLLENRGRVILTGLGKNGYVARKAAATFCSTGTPAIFLHPSEALHGDLGIVTEGDVLIALSNGGETKEVIELLPHMARLAIPVIAITGNLTSSLAVRSQIVLDASVTSEADPISVTPTSSTTVAMAMCDAIAVTLMQHRGFTREQFAIFHPGGNLGRKLLLSVGELMRVGDSVPSIDGGETLDAAIQTISDKRLGAVIVVGDQQQVRGILTDGDLRRIYQAGSGAKQPSPNQQPVEGFMTRQPKTIGRDSLAAEALKLMEDKQITVLAVVDDSNELQGVIHLHDLIRAGLA